MSEKTGGKRVVIVGGGFAGLAAAARLGGSPFEVTLVDRRNFHLFQPLLYQVATGGLSPGEIASPLRKVLARHRNVQVIQGLVTDLNPVTRTLQVDDREIPYDHLILAAGASPSYFGHPEWEAHAPSLKTIEDALEIRRRIFSAFEAAEVEQDPEVRKKLLTFVVVGGGPTGVELAGAVAELARFTLRREFRRIDPASARIVLIELAERILTAYSPELSHSGAGSLADLGVDVRTGVRLERIEGTGVTLRGPSGTEFLPAATVLWGAGMTGSPLGRLVADRTGAELDQGGRLLVAPDLTLPHHPEISVVGDLAGFHHQTGRPLPGVAPVAKQQGVWAAQRLLGRVNGEFRYHDPGSLAVIGRNAAVGQLFGRNVQGWFAWLAWAGIHILSLVEFENRLLVGFQWAWNYFNHGRGARLITAPRPQSATGSGSSECPASPPPG